MAYSADQKPSGLTEITTLATDDTIIVGDTSDTTEVVKTITKANLITDLSSSFQAAPAEGAFVDGDKTKLDGIETGADVTDTANVTAAGALMDSECTSLADVKALNQSVVSGASPTFSTTNFTVHELRVDTIPDTDHTGNGLTTSSINASGTISAFTCAYLDASGTWTNADASATATADKLLVITLEAGTAATPMKVALPGSVIRDDTWTWTVGGAIYLSETTGALTQTAPTTTDAVVRVLGYALSADVMYFQPETGVVHA